MANAAPTALRTILFEQDPDTHARLVVDIREFETPASCPTKSWTTMTRDADTLRRALMLDLSRQIDQLISGEISEISIVAQP